MQHLEAGSVRRIILVAGMHRSGTSALTRLLSVAGATLPKRLNPPAADNPKGYWEPMEIVALHDELLSKTGSSWDDPVSLPASWFDSDMAKEYALRLAESVKVDYPQEAPLIIMKDPRVCKLMPLWIKIAGDLGREPVFVIPVRHPTEVAQSLAKRNAFSYEKSTLLCVRTLVDAERFSRGLRRAFMSYDRLLSDWRSVLSDSEKSLGIQWPRQPATIQHEVEEFLSSQERHHFSASSELYVNGPLRDSIQELYAALEAGHSDSSVLHASFDKVRIGLDDAEALYGCVVEHERKAASLLKEELQRLKKCQSGGREVAKRPSTEMAAVKGHGAGSVSVQIASPLSERTEVYLSAGSSQEVENWRQIFRGKARVNLVTEGDRALGSVKSLPRILSGSSADVVVFASASGFAPNYMEQLVLSAVEDADRFYPNWGIIGNDGLDIDGSTRKTFCYGSDRIPEKSYFARPAVAVSPHFMIINRRALAERAVSWGEIPECAWSHLALSALCYKSDLLTLIDPRLFFCSSARNRST